MAPAVFPHSEQVSCTTRETNEVATRQDFTTFEGRCVARNFKVDLILAFFVCENNFFRAPRGVRVGARVSVWLAGSAFFITA